MVEHSPQKSSQARKKPPSHEHREESPLERVLRHLQENFSALSRTTGSPLARRDSTLLSFKSLLLILVSSRFRSCDTNDLLKMYASLIFYPQPFARIVSTSADCLACVFFNCGLENVCCTHFYPQPSPTLFLPQQTASRVCSSIVG